IYCCLNPPSSTFLFAGPSGPPGNINCNGRAKLDEPRTTIMEPAAANNLMVDRLIGEGALWTPALIAAFRATPRHSFLDPVFQFHPKAKRCPQCDPPPPRPPWPELL